MARDKLPFTVLVALGLASCGTCRPGVCLSIAVDPEEDQGDAEDIGLCLSILPPDEIGDGPIEPCLEAMPDDLVEPPVHPCLSPPVEPLPEEPRPDVCLSVAPPPDIDDPPRPCLSIRRPEPPPVPDDEVDPETLQICLSEDMDPEPAEDDGGAALERAPADERVALLERLGDALPDDVRRRL